MSCLSWECSVSCTNCFGAESWVSSIFQIHLLMFQTGQHDKDCLGKALSCWALLFTVSDLWECVVSCTVVATHQHFKSESWVGVLDPSSSSKFQSMKLSVLNLSNSLFSCDVSTCQDCWGKLICPAEHWCSWLPTLKATAVQHLLHAVHIWQMFICIHTSMSYKRPAHTWQPLLD